METPLQISLHGIAHSEALYDAIREKAGKLDRYYTRIDLKLPGGEIAVTHQHDEDLQVALRGAFDAARRRLEDFARTQRGDVKRHAD